MTLKHAQAELKTKQAGVKKDGQRRQEGSDLPPGCEQGATAGRASQARLQSYRVCYLWEQSAEAKRLICTHSSCHSLYYTFCINVWGLRVCVYAAVKLESLQAVGWLENSLIFHSQVWKMTSKKKKKTFSPIRFNVIIHVVLFSKSPSCKKITTPGVSESEVLDAALVTTEEVQRSS